MAGAEFTGPKGEVEETARMLGAKDPQFAQAFREIYSGDYGSVFSGPWESADDAARLVGLRLVILLDSSQGGDRRYREVIFANDEAGYKSYKAAFDEAVGKFTSDSSSGSFLNDHPEFLKAVIYGLRQRGRHLITGHILEENSITGGLGVEIVYPKDVLADVVVAYRDAFMSQRSGSEPVSEVGRRLMSLDSSLIGEVGGALSLVVVRDMQQNSQPRG